AAAGERGRTGPVLAVDPPGHPVVGPRPRLPPPGTRLPRAGAGRLHPPEVRLALLLVRARRAGPGAVACPGGPAVRRLVSSRRTEQPPWPGPAHRRAAPQGTGLAPGACRHLCLPLLGPGGSPRRPVPLWGCLHPPLG